jgi:hypothetical protein
VALKYTIEKLEDVDEKYRDEYEEKDGKFVLKVEGVPEAKSIDTSDFENRIKALEANNRKLLDEKKKVKEDALKKTGDIDALEKSWQEKIDQIKTEHDEALKSYESTISELTSGAAARDFVSNVFKSDVAEIVMPHISKRLTTEYKDGKPVVRVLDATGNPSAMSIDDLKKEFQTNDKFAPFVIGSKASGGGDFGTKQKQAMTMKRDQFEAMGHREKAAFMSEGGKLVD